MIYMYSFLTLRDSRWMTRELKNKSGKPAINLDTPLGS